MNVQHRSESHEGFTAAHVMYLLSRLVFCACLSLFEQMELREPQGASVTLSIQLNLNISLQ